MHFVRNRSGATAVLVALSMPVVAGGMGLGTEIGYHYMLQRNLQQAADLAAHAGAVRLRAGDGAAGVEAAARHAATMSGFAPVAGVPVSNTPPNSGAFSGSASSVEVQLTRYQIRFFSAVFVDEPVELRARAVANVSASSTKACVLALSPTASPAVTVSGSTSVSIDNCDIAANSNAEPAFQMQGNSRLAVGCVRTVGTAETASGLSLRTCEAPAEYAPIVQDPYADVPEPEVEGNCVPSTSKNMTTFSPDFMHSSGVPALRICGGLDIKKHTRFEPGLYIIDGGNLSLNANADVSADEASITTGGVTFYLANGATLNLSGNGNLNLQAPLSGPYAGILFFGSRDYSGLTHQVMGNSNSVTQGAVYIPTGSIRFIGNSTATNGCTQIIAYTVEFTGNSTLRSSCNTGNIREIETNVMVNIVE